MINLHKYLNELARSTKTEGLRGFYMRLACSVKGEMKARGITRTTLMQVKSPPKLKVGSQLYEDAISATSERRNQTISTIKAIIEENAEPLTKQEIAARLLSHDKGLFLSRDGLQQILQEAVDRGELYRATPGIYGAMPEKVKT